MASLQRIKTRITLIENTRKITKAMELLSSAKLRRVKEQFNSIQEYYLSIFDIFQNLVSKTKEIDKIIKLDENQPSLHILVTSDLGLCGGYNSNVFKEFKKHLKSEDKIIVLGNKGRGLLRDFENQIVQTHLGYGDDVNYDVIAKINKLIMNLLNENQISKINIFYTKFVNSVSFIPTKFQIFPIDKEKILEERKIKTLEYNSLIDFEPNVESVLKNLIPLYISSTIFNYVSESKISEMSSRRMAMESASDNADEIIKYLDIIYNRGRQSAITQEISEIVGGAISLK